MTAARPQLPRIAYGLLFLSGAAALGYEIAWTRQFAAGLGHEAPAMLGVIGAFMAGMALGAWSLGARLARTAVPLRWYAALEFMIVLWALALIPGLPWANDLAIRLLGPSVPAAAAWLVAVVVPFMALLPATAAMGATFPAMERFTATVAANKTQVGAVYAANTAGAVVGVLGTAFGLLPVFGFTHSVLLLAVLSAIAGAGALLLARAAGACREAPGGFDELSSRGPSSRRLSVTIGVTGLLSIGYQVAATRVLSQILENTVFSFAAVLAVYLVGTAIGAAIYQRRAARTIASPSALTTLLAITASACVIGSTLFLAVPGVYQRMRGLGDTLATVLLAEACAAALVLLLPTVAMGALFSHLIQSLRSAGGGVGRALAINTLGSAAGPVVFGLALLPLLGSKWTLIATAAAYLALAPSVRRLSMIATAAVCIAGFALPSRLHPVTTPPGGSVVEFREGTLGAVSVLADAAGAKTLRVNNRFQMGGTAAADAEYRAAHIPLLLHAAPHKALFLGLGTGITMAGGTWYPELKLTGVELIPEVVEVLQHFEPQNRGIRARPGTRIVTADARRFVATTRDRYDVIVADLFHPGRDGAGTLYTAEHFQRIRDRLEPGGLFCQWLPLHQLDEEQFATVLQTFKRIFPHTHGMLLRFNVDVPVLGLIGRAERVAYPSNIVERYSQNPGLAAELKRLGLGDSLRLFGLFVDISSLDEWAPLNTDDHPRITFEAARMIYANDRASFQTLMHVLERTAEQVPSDEWIADRDFHKRVGAYIAARNVYFAGQALESGGSVQGAVERYIESARLSPDFTMGYSQCLSLASVLFRTQPDRARSILERLHQAQPQTGVAKLLLDRLNARGDNKLP